MNNIMFKTNAAIRQKQMIDGLSSYTQSNCQVTLTDDGFRIYRPSNLTTSNNGNTMWGGMRIINSTNYNINHTYDPAVDNIYGLTQGHTYIICFHAKGQSSNAFATFEWSNQMGWGGGGLSPAPSNIQKYGIPTDFNGEQECWYKFTINDTISKTCTTTYSYATQGSEYLSYNHFGVGFTYTSTGALGTDLYITNLRMYDITNPIPVLIDKFGYLKTQAIIEDATTNAYILGPSSETIGGNFYEY